MIEILVVVAIIALLISILLPSLSRAREQSRATVCLSNLKQIGNAMAYYGNDSKDYLPPYQFVRRINSTSSDRINIPYWFQYLPYKYLFNDINVLRCPSDDAAMAKKSGRTGWPELKALRPIIQYSFSMNPNQPKRETAVYGPPDSSPETNPAVIVERFNPGMVTRLRQPNDFAYLLETQSPGLLNPATPLDCFRYPHGGQKDRLNIVFADTHAEPRDIKRVWPGDFVTQRVNGEPNSWPGKFRALWYGDSRPVKDKRP